MNKKVGEMIGDLVTVAWIFTALFLAFAGFICGPMFSVASLWYSIAVFTLAVTTIVLLQLNRKRKISLNWTIFVSGLLMVLITWGPFLYF
jgi:ABC-type multidrug transport system permease subunit